MALLHWRKFAFFDEEVISDTELNQIVSIEGQKDLLENDQPFAIVNLSCSHSGRGNILLGDTNGYVYIINRYLKVNSLKANQKFTSHVKQVSKSSIFITCGSDQDGINPLIKLWDPDKTDSLNQPTCIRVIRANSGFIKPSPVTCIECNDNLTFMAVGYEDGSIVLFHGDVTKQRRSKFGRPIKISDHPVTGIAIRSENKVTQNASSTSNYLGQSYSYIEIHAFIATADEIFYANLSEKTFSKVLLDQPGCQSKCCCMLSGADGKSVNEYLFAVGRDNAVYFYQTDGRGPCLAFEGQKIMLYRFRNYLVIISHDTRTDFNLQRNRRGQMSDKHIQESQSTKRLSLNIYDIKNKYIAHSSVIPSVQEMFSEWGQLFVVCVSGQVLVFREKDTQTKLETLFRKNQFSLVIDIAKSHQYDEDALTEIFKHYGDHLYRKGDFEGAIMQYIKTIGRSEPSYVIKKFLDSRRISNLTVYLEALHKKSCATQDHTKLLLNCYSRLRNDQQLKLFIESYEEGNIKFDLDIAIKVLRDAGFYEFALDLAKKHQKHEWFFKVQMEDKNDSKAALDYMVNMTEPNEIAIYMKKYGRVMLKDAPTETISMIETICQRSRESIARSQNQGTFSYLNLSRKIYPEEFFHIFVDSNDLFVQLLEQLVEGGTEFATKAVYNLLLELYLNSWRKEKDDLMRNLHAEKIKNLLSQPSEKFDIDQALILCRINRFDEGLIDLYARAKLYHLVLQYHIDQDDSLKIIKTCEQYGAENPHLYMPALIHYSKTGDERLSQLLKAIGHLKIIPPMVVIRILLESKRTNLGSVKDYLVRFLKKMDEKLSDNQLAIDRFKDDTEEVRKTIEEFENHQTVFQPSKCSACQEILDLPSVHFLCNHSYHQNCFNDYSADRDECLKCAHENKKLLDDIRSHENSKSKMKEVERSFSESDDDIFNSVAKLFGYGLFN